MLTLVALAVFLITRPRIGAPSRIVDGGCKRPSVEVLERMRSGAALADGGPIQLFIRSAARGHDWLSASTSAAPLARFRGDDGVCALLFVEQPVNLTDTDFITHSAFDYYTAPVLERGARHGPPDDAILRVEANHEARTAEVPGPRLQLVSAPVGRTTTYAAHVSGAVLAALIADVTSAGGDGAASVRLTIRVRVSRRAYSWDCDPKVCLPPEVGTPSYEARASFELLPDSHPPRSALPLCDLQNSNAPGRWVQTDVDGRAPPGALGAGRALKWAWEPRTCSLRPFTPADVRSCFERRGWTSVLMLGDSNIRRDWKVFAGLADSRVSPDALGALAPGNSAWCVDRRADANCVCEDNAEQGTFTADTKFQEWTKACGYARIGNTWLLRDWFTGFVPEITDSGEAILGWVEIASRYDASIAEPTSMGMPVPVRPPYGVVIFDLVHWDVAFGALEGFEEKAVRFGALLADAHPAPTLIVYRTPNFFAGSPTEGRPMKSITRMRAFHEAALRALRSALGSRLIVWDVHAMTEALPLDASTAMNARCDTGHYPSEVLDVTVGVLLNAMCNGE